VRILELYEKVLPDISKEAIMSEDNGVLQRFNEMITKSQVLKKHANSIWQGTGKDKRWKTTIANNRVIAKNTERELLEYLANYYDMSGSYTLTSLYPEWLEYKQLHTRSSFYLSCIDFDWRRFYLGTEIASVPINKLTKVELDEWAHKMIRMHDMTKKQYYNMAIIMRQSLSYAVDKGYISKNFFSDIKVDPKLFRIKKKPASETQVYLTDEIDALKKAAYDDYEDKGETSSLAIIIGLLTGLRVGELVALKECDIGDTYLHIERQEVKVELQDEDGHWKRNGYEIVEHTKTSAGTRDVYMPVEVRDLFEKIRKNNLDRGLNNPDQFLFFNTKGERMHERSLNRKLCTLCNRIGIPFRSIHKLRKTYISKLIDEGVNINTIREMVGHEDERITYSNYCFDRKNRPQIEEQLERILATNDVVSTCK